MAKRQSRGGRQDSDPGRRGHARAAGRNRARSARHQHHGLLQGVQRRRRSAARHGRSPPRSRSTRTASFTFVTKTPPTPVLLRQAAGIEKGSQTPRREMVATVTKDQVREIAETKMPDLNAIDLEGAMAQVAGTARSMGIDVTG